MAEVSELAGRPILILKEGTTRTRGRAAQHANIMAARIIADAIRSSLGPQGMDKMLVDSFGDITITNDGATVLDEMDVQHPAAKMMVEVAKTQDKEVGDGTTTAVVLAGDLLAKAEELIEKDIHPTIIADGYRKALNKALELLEEMAIKVDPMDREVLKRIVMTSISGKSIAEHKDYIADVSLDAVLQVARKKDGEYTVDIDDVKVEKRAGGTLRDTKLTYGIVLDKEVVHPDMLKSVRNAKIALLDCPLEIEKTEFDAKINIESPEQMKAFISAEEKMLSDMVEKIEKAGANVVISQKGIDDLAQFFLARKGIMAVRRVKSSDMEKLAKATGAKIVTNIDDLSAEHLGYAELVEERKIEDERWTFVSGCKDAKAVTILVRGASEKIVDEAERSIHDALCVIKDVVEEPKILAGGGAPEMELAHQLKKYAEKFSGREQLALLGFAEALEGIPMALAENSGLDPIDILVELRAAHERGEKTVGIDAISGKVVDTYKLDIVDPLKVKKQMLKSACEAATMILRIDDVIAATRAKEEAPPKPGAEEEGAGEGAGEEL